MSAGRTPTGGYRDRKSGIVKYSTVVKFAVRGNF